LPMKHHGQAMSDQMSTLIGSDVTT
jgi:hypothetical protein